MNNRSQKLGEVVVKGGLQTGPFGSQLKADEYVSPCNESIPVVMPTDIDRSTASILAEEIKHTSKVKADTLQKHRLQEGDLIFPRRGDLNKVAVVTDEQAGWICGTGCLRARLEPSWVNFNFLSFYAQQNSVGQWLTQNAVGQTMLNLNTEIIANLPIQLPPLAEQERIVEILSDADAAINTAERSLATRQKRLRGLIQTLIGNHQNGENWEILALEDIGKISSAGVDKKSVEGEQPTTLLNYMDVYRLDRILASDLSHQVTAPSAKVSSCNLQKGDIFFTPTSEKRDDIARSAVACEDIDSGVYSYHVVRLRPSINLDINFSSYAFQTNDFMRQAYRLADGSGQRYVISLGGFRSMTVALPPIEQQQAIGICLSEARSELEKITSEVTALKKQKRGLMQQLLTGKLRVAPKNGTAQ